MITHTPPVAGVMISYKNFGCQATAIKYDCSCMHHAHTAQFTLFLVHSSQKTFHSMDDLLEAVEKDKLQPPAKKTAHSSAENLATTTTTEAAAKKAKGPPPPPLKRPSKSSMKGPSKGSPKGSPETPRKQGEYISDCYLESMHMYMYWCMCGRCCVGNFPDNYNWCLIHIHVVKKLTCTCTMCV